MHPKTATFNDRSIKSGLLLFLDFLMVIFLCRPFLGSLFPESEYLRALHRRTSRAGIDKVGILLNLICHISYSLSAFPLQGNEVTEWHNLKLLNSKKTFLVVLIVLYSQTSPILSKESFQKVKILLTFNQIAKEVEGGISFLATR